mmetsp:Transcript_19642/g.33765  ORF Transcript_19642/g.33765 Transcript_19642/m.33765 type:complete len:219 (+) Transcript_19642:293-949(+)
MSLLVLAYAKHHCRRRHPHLRRILNPLTLNISRNNVQHHRCRSTACRCYALVVLWLRVWTSRLNHQQCTNLTLPQRLTMIHHHHHHHHYYFRNWKNNKQMQNKTNQNLLVELNSINWHVHCRRDAQTSSSHRLPPRKPSRAQHLNTTLNLKLLKMYWLVIYCVPLDENCDQEEKNNQCYLQIKVKLVVDCCHWVYLLLFKLWMNQVLRKENKIRDYHL